MRRTDTKLQEPVRYAARYTIIPMTHEAALMIPTRSGGAATPAIRHLSVTLGSGRKVSKASLFIVLQAGGWAAAFAVCALAAEEKQGLWPSLFNTLIWAFCGFLVTLGIRPVHRRLRRLHDSYVVIGAIALVSSVLLAPLWYFMEILSVRWA